MGKNKLAKFAEMANFENVIQVSPEQYSRDHELKGNWAAGYFRNNHPVILELGCGKGEYSVALAEKYPGNNYVGIDIKGARMYTGAKQAIQKCLRNVAFLRTHIENAGSFFARDEVDEIWLTFPDPQMKKPNKRLTSGMMLQKYCLFLKPGGVIHLKTDSQFLYAYTLALVKLNQLSIVNHTDDLYASGKPDNILGVQTFYEKQWLGRGIKIKYLSFKVQTRTQWLEPEEEFEKDSYRSFGRSARV